MHRSLLLAQPHGSLRSVCAARLVFNPPPHFFAQMFDTDHSGEIDEDEFAMLLEYLGIELSEEELEKMFNRFDTVGHLPYC